jgi:nucleoid DNA-binding protein
MNFIMASSNKVTKTALIAQIADKMQISQSQAEKFLNVFIETVTANLKKGTEVTITGFGTFRKTNRKARKGVNPKTGEPMDIAASTSVSFKTGKTLKEAVA